MNKQLTNLFSKGVNNKIELPNRNSFSYKGSWIGVYPGTVMDKWHVGDFSSVIYNITVEFGSNEKEIMQLSVVARPDRAVATIFGRSSINQELISISVTVDASVCYVNIAPKSTSYSGAKVVFHATYAKAINQLVPPAIVADTSTEEQSGINTFDSITSTMDNTTLTFDKG